jgi:tetratricopeptide (TPR) repeat protein
MKRLDGIAWVLTVLGAWMAATANAEPRPAVASERARAALERAGTLRAREEWAEARAAYQEAMAEVEDKAHRALILRSIAETYSREKKLDTAITTLKQALALVPGDVESLRLIARLLADSGKEKEAQEYLAKLPAAAAADSAALLSAGIRHFNDGEMAEALAELDRVVKENPKLPEAYYYRGLAYLSLGKIAEGKAAFRKLLELDPKSRFADEVEELLEAL